MVCEGAKTEVNYFERLKEDLPNGVLDNNVIEVRGEGMGTKRLVEETEQIRIRRERDTGRKFDQTWAFFDKDDFPDEQFNTAIRKGISSNPPIKCAWSNQAFELWYLLHFNYIGHQMSRDDYRQHLESVVKSASGVDFSYQKNDPNIYFLLKEYGNPAQAILWAEKIEAQYGERKDYAKHNPCTKVHHLVSSLIALRD